MSGNQVSIKYNPDRGYYVLWGRETFYDETRKMLFWETRDEALEWIREHHPNRKIIETPGEQYRMICKDPTSPIDTVSACGMHKKGIFIKRGRGDPGKKGKYEYRKASNDFDYYTGIINRPLLGSFPFDGKPMGSTAIIGICDLLICFLDRVDFRIFCGVQGENHC